jgi:hypothetical protein
MFLAHSLLYEIPFHPPSPLEHYLLNKVQPENRKEQLNHRLKLLTTYNLPKAENEILIMILTSNMPSGLSKRNKIKKLIFIKYIQFW